MGSSTNFIPSLLPSVSPHSLSCRESYPNDAREGLTFQTRPFVRGRSRSLAEPKNIGLESQLSSQKESSTGELLAR